MKEKLSDDPNERLLIVNADDLGITQSTNRAICELFQKGAITSASIMMPCESAREAADLCVRNGITDIGVHFTLTGNAFMPVYRERRLHSLTDANGYFHQDAELLEKNADPEEVWLELEAQLQAAISSGIEPTHADSHAGSLFGLFAGRDFLEIALELCGKYGVAFNLPLRIVEEPSFSDSQKRVFCERIGFAKGRGVPLIDDLIGLPYPYNAGESYDDVKKQLIGKLTGLKPGITQLTTHPSYVSEELIAVTPHYRKREMEYALLIDPEIKRLLETEGIRLASWKTVRDGFYKN